MTKHARSARVLVCAQLTARARKICPILLRPALMCTKPVLLRTRKSGGCEAEGSSEGEEPAAAEEDAAAATAAEEEEDDEEDEAADEAELDESAECSAGASSGTLNPWPTCRVWIG